MKKRTKITLRTKIYLTIAGLLGLTGILYAATPTPFSSGVPFPTGVAAAPDLLLVTPYCADEYRSDRLRREATLLREYSGVWFLPGKIHDFRSIAVRRRPGSPRATFSSQKALWSSRSTNGRHAVMRRSPGASHRTTTGLRSTILAHMVLT